jgi:hypothetical protein
MADIGPAAGRTDSSSSKRGGNERLLRQRHVGLNDAKTLFGNDDFLCNIHFDFESSFRARAGLLFASAPNSDPSPCCLL